MNTNSPEGLAATYSCKLKGEGPCSDQWSCFPVTFQHYLHPLVATSSCQPPPKPRVETHSLAPLRLLTKMNLPCHYPKLRVVFFDAREDKISHSCPQR